MLKLVGLCLGLQIKSEGIDFTFFFFFAIELMTTQMSTQHIWIGKALEAPLLGSEQLRVIYKQL